MPKYSVPVTFSQTKPITVYARDAQEAEEKAIAVVLGWKDIEDAEAKEAEEIET